MGGSDLVDLVPQHVGLAGPLVRRHPRGRERVVERVQLAAQRTHAAEIGAGERIEHVALRGGGDEGAVLVLPVDLDQLRRRLAQRTQRGHAAVDPRPGPPLRGDRTGEDHLALGVALSHDEARLDERLRRASPHHARVGPPAEDQLQGLDDQRLARPGLARQGGHAGTELEGEVLDHTEVAHVQVGQHGTVSGPGARRSRKRRMLPKVWGSFRTTRTERAATLQVMVAPGCSRPTSSPSTTSTPARSGTTSTSTTCSSVSTRLRSREKWGATGVTTRARSVGARMGPPAERL